jgi:Sec-independent protein translocase protein TatA
MEILGIGPLELVFILLIALIVLGPKDMVKAGRTLGRFLRSVITSPTWKAVTQTSHELRRLPNRLIREAGLEEELRKLEETKRQASLGLDQRELEKWERDISPWTTPPQETPGDAEQRIQPTGEPAEEGLPDSRTADDRAEDFTADNIGEDQG